MGLQWYRNQEQPILILLSALMGLLERLDPHLLISLTEKNLKIQPRASTDLGNTEETRRLVFTACSVRFQAICNSEDTSIFFFFVPSPFTPFCQSGILFLSFRANEMLGIIQSPAAKCHVLPTVSPTFHLEGSLLLGQTQGPWLVLQPFSECGLHGPGGWEDGWTWTKTWI